MKYIFLIMSVFYCCMCAGQDKNYNVNLYVHPELNPNIQYAAPLQRSSPVSQNVVIVQMPPSNLTASPTVDYYVKRPFHDINDVLRYQQINKNTNELELSTKDGKIYEYFVPRGTGKYEILSHDRRFLAWCIRRGNKWKMYNAAKKVMAKTKAPQLYPAWLW